MVTQSTGDRAEAFDYGWFGSTATERVEGSPRMTTAPRPTLKRQLRRSASFGFPSLVLGAAAAGGAVWLGLDATGLAILVVGVMLLLFGAFLVVITIAGTVAVAETTVRRKLRPNPPGRPRSLEQSTAIAEEPAAQPSAPRQDDGGKPLIF